MNKLFELYPVTMTTLAGAVVITAIVWLCVLIVIIYWHCRPKRGNISLFKNGFKHTENGHFLPRVTTIERLLMPTPADGLLVYDEDRRKVFAFREGMWNIIK